MKQKIELTEEQEELAFDMVLQGKKLQEIAQALGFRSTHALQKYKMNNPHFLELFERARKLETEQIEEQIRYLTDNHNAEYAKIQLEILTRLLKWRDPKRYGDKTQIDMTMAIDISGALDRAERRVSEIAATNVLQLKHKLEDE